MNNKTLVTLYFIILISFSSCKNKEKSLVDFRIEDFKESHYLLKGQEIRCDSLFLGQPTLLRYHPDSFIIIEEYGTSHLIKIIDLNSNNIQLLIPRGRGPGEMIVSWGVEIVDQNIYLFCGQLRKVIILSLNNDRKFFIKGEIFLEEKQTQRFHPISRELFVCLSNIGDENRITILDAQGSIIKKFGDYPPFMNDTEIKPDNDIFFSSIGSSPDGRFYAVICTKTDIIELYKSDNGLLKRIQGPLGINLKIQMQNVANGFMLRPVPHYIAYHHVIANNREFWTGFIGFEITETNRPSSIEQCSKTVFCFDWKGTPIRKINLFHPAISFDLDWTNSVLYTLELIDNYPKIFKTDIKSVFGE